MQPGALSSYQQSLAQPL